METNKSNNGASKDPRPTTSIETSPSNGGATATAVPEVQEFDLSSARLTQDFGSLAGVKKLLTTVPVRKPNRQEFFRVHSDPTYRMLAAVLELKEEQENYLLAQNVYEAMPGEWAPRELVTAVNRQGVVFIWQVPMPGQDGRTNSWHEAAREAAARAQNVWIRMAANMSLGAYEIYQAPDGLSEPVWPEEDFQTLLRVAYKGKYITDTDHAVLRRLRGEV